MKKKKINWTVGSGANQGNAGFTLIELMIAMAISGIIAATIYLAYATQQKTYTAQNAVVEMQQNLRAAFLVMENELRMAGFDPYKSGNAGVTAASANKLSFSFVTDTNNNGKIDKLDGVTAVTYLLYDAYSDGVNDLGRQVGSSPSNKKAIALNIENIEFLYILNDGTQTTAPTGLNKIRSVRISVLARSSRTDMKSAYHAIFTAGSGTTWTFNDKTRRRLLVETVTCRNLGL